MMVLYESVIKHFKLARDPFTGELSSSRDIFLPRSTSIVELRLWKAIDECQIAALVGDVGSGKTTIMAKVLDQMESNRQYRIVRIYAINRKKLTPSQLCDAFIEDLTGRTCFNSLEMKVRLISEALGDAQKSGHKVALIIDDAHELPTQTLKDLKKLHEIRGKFKAVLSILLIGQLQLLRRLQREVTLKEMLERVEVIEAKGFKDPKTGSMDESQKYISWKLQRAGGRKVEDLFTKDGLEMLLDHPAARYPLGINNLVSAALCLAKEADEDKINEDVVANALSRVDLDGQVEEEEDDAPKQARKVG